MTVEWKDPSITEWIALIATDSATAELADIIDNELEPTRGGRPAKYNTRLKLALLAGSLHYGGDLSTATQLQRSNWESLDKAIHHLDPSFPLPPEWPTRDTMRKFRDRLADRPELVAALRDRSRKLATQAAMEIGALLPGATLDANTPISSCLVADQTTLALAATELKDPVNNLTGESDDLTKRRTRLMGTDAIDGTGTRVHGNTIVSASVYTGYPNERIIIDTAVLPRVGNEDDPALLDHRSEGRFWVELLESLREDGINRDHIAAIIHDGAVKGEHVESLIRDHGIVVLTPVALTDTVISIPTVTFANDDGTTCTHFLTARKSELCAEVLGKGDRAHTTRLEHLSVEIVTGPDGYRALGVWAIPCAIAGAPHIYPLAVEGRLSTVPRGSKRPTEAMVVESLRPVPASSAIHKRLYTWSRTVAESTNNRIKLLLERRDRQRTWNERRLAVDLVTVMLEQMVRASHFHDVRIARDGDTGAAAKPPPRSRAMERSAYEAKKADRERRQVPGPESAT